MNTTNTEGVFDQAKGKVKQAVGEAFNNQQLANEGAADQVKGHAKEAWGNVKDTASRLGHDDATAARENGAETGHDVRTSVANAAANAKDAINRGLNNLEREHAKHS
jgi:uncharacterized protein YjbJ (UPF0337 family)